MTPPDLAAGERENEWEFRSNVVRLGESYCGEGGWEPFAVTPAFDQSRSYPLSTQYVVWLRRRKDPTP